jgi:mono/diheme cytochrome c family protein
MRLISIACLAVIIAGCAKSKETPPIEPELAKQLYAGEVVFIEHCISCHTESRKDIPSLAPNNPTVVGEKARLLSIFLKHNDLDSLTDDDISHVLTYVRNTLGNSAEPITLVDVSAARNPDVVQ